MDVFNTRHTELREAYSEAFATETGIRTALTGLSAFLPPAAQATTEQLLATARTTRRGAMAALLAHRAAPAQAPALAPTVLHYEALEARLMIERVSQEYANTARL